VAALILVVVASDLAAIGIAASATSVRFWDLRLFGVLLLCNAASVELTRPAGEGSGVNKDIYGVWDLPIAILLPPVYALIAPILPVALWQWRIRRAAPYRRVYTAASIGLSYGAASVGFHYLVPMVTAWMSGSFARTLAWSLLALICGVGQSGINKLLIGIAAKGAEPTAPIWAAFFRREPLYNDLAELCIGVVVAYGVATNLFVALLALPFVTPMQRSLRHAQLLKDSRTDAKTGLLNASTWEKEATVEVVRAVRTRTPLAVAILDIDRFKEVNDTHGHLAGDQVIKEIAQTLTNALREYDLAGRFGGEEFVLLLPHTRSADALLVAERVRAQISRLGVLPGSPSGEPIHVTVSVGVAALDGGAKRELRELLAAADSALYRAKGSGRDQVQMISTTRGLSAVSGLSAPNGPNPVWGSAQPKAPDAAADAPVETVAPPLGSGSTASTSPLAVWHSDALPVCSTSGVGKLWHVQPLTATGAPPPFPSTLPDFIRAA
jgi:diguanylate cyclase (GGDEF)-like protein